MRNWKTYLIFSLFLLLAGVIISKLYLLQVKKGEYYEALALGQQFSFEEKQKNRGEIFLMQEGLPLAQNKAKNILYFLGEEMAKESTSSDQALVFLADIFKLEKALLDSFIDEGEVLKTEISDEEMARIRQEEIAGTHIRQIFGRSYPYKDLASHLVGFLNEEGQGQYGLEGYYDEILTKEEADIFLTLDYNIQYFAEKLLEEAQETWQVKSGQIIVMEPLTGKILALAHLPSFDPNQYWAEDLEIFLNGATQKLFEPGSVFKPITMAAALEEELITPETIYEDTGSVEVGGEPIFNFEKRIWGEQTMTDVLEESINTGAVFVQQELGGRLFLKYLEKFGLFEKTDIDLQGEVASSNKSLKRKYQRDLATASFGQGVEMTPLQLVRAFGAIANGGKLMRPYLVEKIVKSNGQEILTEPKVQEEEVISPAIAAQLTSMLINVVEQGSGRRTKVPNYFIAGKTGTAQVALVKGGYSEDKTIQSFIGYFPAMAPEVLIFVKLDDPQGVKTAGYCAVPLFQKLAKHIIDLWQIPPSYED